MSDMIVIVVLAIGLVGVLAVSAWLSVIDFRTHRLPNRIVGPLALGVAVWLLVLGVVEQDLGRSLAAIGWGFAVSGTFLVLHFAAGLGMGDVKYAWPVAATLGWFGWPALRIALFALVIAGALAGFAALARGRGKDHRLAYGPFMALGLACGVLYGLTV